MHRRSGRSRKLPAAPQMVDDMVARGEAARRRYLQRLGASDLQTYRRDLYRSKLRVLEMRLAQLRG